MASKNNIPIKKSWGQNFLIDDNIINKIITVINPKKKDVILEIGPGHGALTKELFIYCNNISAVEIDPLLCKSLNKKFNTLKLFNEDILKWNNKEDILYNKIIGNVPYNISSQIIFKFLSINTWDTMVLMLQKELAQRIIGKSGTKQYGRISVMAQNLSNISYMFDISKNVFHPKPQVNSSILIFTKIKISFNIDKFSLFIKQAFKQRRKKLKNNLKDYYNLNYLELYGEKRPGDLSPKEYLDLFNKIYF